MNNRLIHRFLLLALSCNMLSPLVAIDGSPAGVVSTAIPTSTVKAEVPTTVGTTPVGADASVGTASESLSGFWGMFPRAWQDLKSTGWWIWGGLESAGSDVRGHYFKKPETWEDFKKPVAARDALIGLSVLIIAKHYLDLRAIDIKIGISEAESASGNNFLFGSWRYKTERYKTSHDIFQHAEEVKKALWGDVHQGVSRIHIMNNAGVRITPKDVTKLDLQTALAQEQENLRKYLNTISYLTDAPKKIFELARESVGFVRVVSGDSYLWYQDAAFHEDCMNHFKRLDAAGLARFEQDLFNNKCNSFIKQAVFVAPGLSFWRFWRWREGIWYSKASKLYWKVYTRYLRTCALYDIVSLDKDIIDPEQPVLGKLLTQVSDMSNNQVNVYNDYETKRTQLARLQIAVDILRDAIAEYIRKRKNSIVVRLRPIEGQFRTINAFLQDQKNGIRPATDTAGITLDQIVRELHSIIAEEKRLD